MTVSVCIIGSGYSAAALTLHLLTRGVPADRLAIVGPGQLGQGQAYGCVSDDFRLNVRAELMRLWPDRPDHFAEWAAVNITDDPDARTDAGDFFRRRDFAAYMADQLASIPAIADISRHEQRADRISKGTEGWRITLGDGTALTASRVVFATGNPAPDWPMKDPPADAPGLVRVPWRGDWPARIAPDAEVVIIGGGLTALDALHSLHRRTHDGPVSLICPEGMLPPVQTDWQDAAPLRWPTPLRGSGFLRFMRRNIGDTDWSRTEWQRRFESLRVNISAAWQSLPEDDQARLMRRIGWLWSLARFRAGPQATGSAQAMLDSGQLTIRRDIVTGLTAGANHARHLVSLGDGARIEADAVINCSGAGRDRLMSRLIGDRVIATHQTAPHRPRMTTRLTLVRPNGTPYEDLFAIGPGTAHVVGDILGAASISRQAAALADRLAADA
jgi:uncharacterized NAD(P)/FAD-binding protein YdhS